MIVDEAQHCRVKHLEAIRALSDAARCGVVLAGSLGILRTLRGPGRVGLELQQLWSRVALQRRLSPLSAEETRWLLEQTTTVPIDEAAAAHLVEYSAGVPRVLAMALERASDILALPREEQFRSITLDIAKSATDELAAPNQ